MNETKTKIAKTSKAIAIILKIGFIIMAVAIVATIIGMGVLMTASSGVSTSLQQALTIATSGTSIAGGEIYKLVIVMAMAIIQLAIIFAIFFIMYQVFRSISHAHSPFVLANAKKIKVVSLLIIIMGVFGSVNNYVAGRLLIGKASYEIDFMWLIMAVIIYCIALIFDYGCQLQQQSDETL